MSWYLSGRTWQLSNTHSIIKQPSSRQTMKCVKGTDGKKALEEGLCYSVISGQIWRLLFLSRSHIRFQELLCILSCYLQEDFEGRVFFKPKLLASPPHSTGNQQAPDDFCGVGFSGPFSVVVSAFPECTAEPGLVEVIGGVRILALSRPSQWIEFLGSRLHCLQHLSTASPNWDYCWCPIWTHPSL